MLKHLMLYLLPSLFFTLIVGNILIPKLRDLKIRQQIRTDGPKTHIKKTGTPTMGGLLFIISIVLSRIMVFAFTKSLPCREEILILCLMLSYGLIGFIDDYRQVLAGHSLGLKAREKIALQILFAALFMWFFVERGSTVIIPFTGKTLELGVLYPILGIVLITGSGNGMNFTDGLDGLAAGIAIFGLGAYSFITIRYICVTNNQELFSVATLALSTIGALGGFLVYNYNPAKVFMGDTGSLALGGLLAGYAIVTQTELVFIFIVAVQLIEVISVILQVFSFQVFGKRIFKMAPLHHHFELLGWREKQVVHLFWFISLAMAFLGIASMAYI